MNNVEEEPEGMASPEIQSSQLASPKISGRRTCYRRFENEREQIDKIRKDNRKASADDFRTEYFYCTCQDNKTCIWSGGRCHSWSADSCGITWAGVHGKDWICVVTKTGDLDLSRVHGYLKLAEVDEVFRDFRRAVISELEDLADTCSELHRKLGKRIKKPFGVVSVAALPGKVHKASCKFNETKFMKLMVDGLIREMEGASSDESEIDEEFDEDDEDACIIYNVKTTRKSWRDTPPNNPDFDDRKGVWFLQREMEKEEMNREAAITIDKSVEESSDKRDDEKNSTEAIKFLWKKMKKPVNYFTPEETVKTAISVFQRLCNTNFNANEIQVSIMDPDYFILTSEHLFKDAYVNHLETVEIEKYLSDMKDQAEEWMLSNHH